MSQVIEAIEIDRTVPVSDLEVRRLLGIEGLDDPDQAARRMVAAGAVPHLRIGRRIRFSLPALRKWAAEKINNSVVARAATK